MTNEVRAGRACCGHSMVSKCLVLVFCGLVAWAWYPEPMCAADAAKDPQLCIPFSSQPPTIDGELRPGEWKLAAALSMFEAYPLAGVPRVMRQEQPVFYVCWDKDNLYVAMDSIDSNTNTIVAACSVHDNKRIIGDDCLELMVAPGAGDAVNRLDFPTYYFAINSIRTIWDARFFPLLAETHNSWESGAQVANSVDGTRWVCEMRIPLKATTKRLPEDGQVWRMNFDRTYSGYNWLAWNARGGLNDARVGGDVTFTTQAAAARLLKVHQLADGKLRLGLEVANPTAAPQTVKLSIQCTGQQTPGTDLQAVGSGSKEITVGPNKVVEVDLGRGQRLLPHNKVVLDVVDAAGRRLLYIERQVDIPAPRFVKRVAPKQPLVYIFPRFLPSLDRLAVLVDYTAWANKTGYIGKGLKAEIQVFAKAAKRAKPVMEGVLRDFKNCKGTWRRSTKGLAQGEYSVKVKVVAGRETIAVHDDWFEKKIFDWMVNKRGVGQRVPAPYTRLAVDGNQVRLWGRRYVFARTGLPSSIVSQRRQLLAGQVELLLAMGNKPVRLQVRKPFSFTGTKPALVRGKSLLAAKGLSIALESTTEYDGFVLFRLTYAPASRQVVISRLRLRVPLAAKYARCYSAAGDTQGTTVPAAVLPNKQGRVFDSLNDTRSVCCSPTFATLLWVGDYQTCFCYAADNDKGWVLRDDAPAVELYRQNDQLVMWLNLVDREYTLTKPRTLEFAFQAGPLKPLPKGWRGFQDGGNADDAQLTFLQVGGGGTAMRGGTHILYPGDTPELREKSHQHIQKFITRPDLAVVGYHFWGMVPKGLHATRVFRGEWGIDKFTWDAAKRVRKWEWQNRFYGDNKDLYVMLPVKLVPSYVDFITYAFDQTLKHTQLLGFYDDTGYPKPVYDEELGLGFVREDGRKVYSSGLWIYRDRWKRAAYVAFENGRPNYLLDSQHVHAHFMPAYGFIGIWAPCERGYYNPFPDRDNLGFYGSLERYAAFNPSKAFGQVPMVGMSSPQWKAPLSARDTRSMMMLALLHDQDVGSFGRRDLRIVCELRHARNLFKPWRSDVRFLGYWQTERLIRRDVDGIRVSLYHAPRRALFIVGNVADAPALATVEPNWKMLKLNPSELAAVDAETTQRIALNAGPSGTGFRIKVPRHDVRLVMVAPPDQCPRTRQKLGRDLPKPKRLLKQFCDGLAGPQLASCWEKDLHQGDAGVWILDGRLCMQGAHYGYAHVRRKFGLDNVSVQCLIMRKPTGCADVSGGSLFLYWPNRHYVQATPGTNRKKFTYVLSGKPTREGSATSQAAVPGWYPYCANWVKIVLKPSTIEFYGSAEGKRWHKDWVAERDAAHAGPPQYLMLGNGHSGERPHLDNVVSRHFRPKGHQPCTFFSDLVVGRD